MEKQALETLFARGGVIADLLPIKPYIEELATSEEMPDAALAMCAARIEEAGPALRAALAEAADRAGLDDDEARLFLRGLHILGAARDVEAWPLLRRLLRRSSEDIDDLLGDAVGETLAQIVAGIFDGNCDALFDDIADRSIDQFVRETLLSAAAFLTWEGRIDREAMRAFLKRFYRERLAADGEYVWIGWLEAIARLGWRDLAPLVHGAWDEGRIPSIALEREHFEEDLAEAERAPENPDRFTRNSLGYIEDVVRSLDWAREDDALDLDEEDVNDDEYDSDDEDWTPSRAGAVSRTPVINPWRHVGRNDPCPCGSGKKAKKCCLSTG